MAARHTGTLLNPIFRQVLGEFGSGPLSGPLTLQSAAHGRPIETCLARPYGSCYVLCFFGSRSRKLATLFVLRMRTSHGTAITPLLLPSLGTFSILLGLDTFFAAFRIISDVLGTNPMLRCKSGDVGRIPVPFEGFPVPQWGSNAVCGADNKCKVRFILFFMLIFA